MRKRANKGVLSQAKAAAAAKVLGKLVRKHPLIAAELALAGTARGIAVAAEEVKQRILPRHDVEEIEDDGSGNS
ncbi:MULTISPECIES: hypothetical protein [Rhizobium]|uniref:hypothetical protein n=1 Tax=Rhizobium TaxID=379 RepID=UPI001B339178|nr:MULTISPECIES: hypothetical protein [Rhizobium]MBX4909891.1 hypothetical protein [Rhizobium bangladeshense]MBX5217552.1 hypothetical protein [Rhizobium sp. NLR9a]MBX5223653.1 hypothetical protein [Rhizobium sp. NLR8a]MBX5229011.1 hypothetical protein [Rhizobium sp. NLR9b]MBX5235557.1 hypothetical protein [Rhizobium sp. NLR4a]